MNPDNLENEIKNYELSKLIKDLKAAELLYGDNPLGTILKLSRQEIIKQVMYSYKCNIKASCWANRFRLLKEEYKRIGGNREFLESLFEKTERKNNNGQRN